jgi:hypothetical protein
MSISIARPFTYTQSIPPTSTESIGFLHISAHQEGVFSNFGPTSGYEWWNGPDEIPGYVIATYVTTVDHSTPDGNVGNVKFWRTYDLDKSQFINLSNGLIGAEYESDEVIVDLELSEYWTSYKYTIFYGGDFTQLLGNSKVRFGALRKTDGQLDLQPNDYNWGELNPSFNSSVLDIYHKTDGKMLVSGLYTESFGDSSRQYLIQIDTTTFSDDYIIRSDTFDNYVSMSIYNRFAKCIVCVGYFTTYDSGSSAYITGINDILGSEDTRFGYGLNGAAFCIDQDSVGNMYVGGSFTNYKGNACSYVVGIKPDGDNISDVSNNVVLDSSVLDIKYGSNTDGEYFIAVGQFTGMIMKYDITNATVSNIFSAFNNRARAVDIAVDGSIIVGGQFTAYGGTGVNRICKINPDGTINSTFATNIGSGFNSTVNDVKCLPDGSILVGGQFSEFNGDDALYIAKIDANGYAVIDWDFASEIGANGIVSCISPR